MYKLLSGVGLNWVAVLLLTLFLSVPLMVFAEENGSKDPFPYEPNEFSIGLQDFHRFEQVFVGAFPLAIFFAQLLGGFGLVIEDAYYRNLTGSDREPLKFGVENYRFDDKIRILSAGIGISFGIAIADMLIYQTKKKKANGRYKRRRILNSSEEKNERDNIKGGIPPGTTE